MPSHREGEAPDPDETAVQGDNRDWAQRDAGIERGEEMQETGAELAEEDPATAAERAQGQAGNDGEQHRGGQERGGQRGAASKLQTSEPGTRGGTRAALPRPAVAKAPDMPPPRPSDRRDAPR